MTEEAGNELIENYIQKYTHPVQWVGWWYEASDETAKSALGEILFDPEGDSLRDLTSPRIREEVIRVVMGSRSLLRSIGAEVTRLLDDAAQKAAEEEDFGP